jgi:hypothetical protein
MLYFYRASVLGVGNAVMGIFSSADNNVSCEYDLIAVHMIAQRKTELNPF